jgi:hypothetical protein
MKSIRLDSTLDAGLLAYRELDEALELLTFVNGALTRCRQTETATFNFVLVYKYY